MTSWRWIGGMRRLAALGLIALAASAPGTVAAQTIDGVLLERGTERPIDLGLVMLLTPDGDSVSFTLTDSVGGFRVQSPTPGEFLLSATALGYKPTVASSVFTLEDQGHMSLEFRIEPRPFELGGITIEAQSSLIQPAHLVQNGFVDRARSGFGRFITPGEIDATVASSTADLLSRTNRITTRYEVGGERILMLGQVGYCTPTVYLDGLRISIGETSIDAIVPVEILSAVEVYRTASEAPLRYGGGMGGCGVIVLWTRRR